MNSPKTTRSGREPAGRASRLAHRAGDGKQATIKISHSVTSDIPDGRPWPPPESNALWVMLRRADGCTLWRAIELAQVRPAATDLCNFPTGSNRIESQSNVETNLDGKETERDLK
jgi:hypothetical protein